MESEWSRLRIDQVAEKVAMGPFGSSIKVSTFVPIGVPVISGQHLHGTRLEDSEYNFITPEHAEKLKNANVYRGDVIFTHAGNIGQVAYIPPCSQYDRYVISQRQFFMRCNKTLIKPSFVTYYFKTHEGQHKLLANSSPSGVPSIAQPVTYLRSIEIPVPPLLVQEAIACILGAFDDKIELNRRMNRTLEEMAQAIFKSWFVDFDPVRAKADGRDTGLPSEIADLFPDGFEESEMGEIPKGWSLGTLGEVADNPRRSIAARDIKPDTPYIALEHMPRRSINLSNWAMAEAIGSNKFEFHNGEILFGKLRPYFHKVGIAPLDGVCSTDILVIVPKRPEWFGLCTGHFSSDAMIQHADRTSTGTKMPRTNWNDLSCFKIAIPQLEIAAEFTKQSKHVIDRMQQALHESAPLPLSATPCCLS